MHGLRKYYLWKLELRTTRIDLPLLTNDIRASSSRNSKHHSIREYVTCEVGYYRHHLDRGGEPLLKENEYIRLMQKIDELRDTFEKATSRVHHELRKLTISLQSDFDEIKRKLLES
jgi:hypothetical protein